VSADESARAFGTVFDTVAAEYDAHRPTYPDELVDRACLDLAAGDRVLEVGCGTGQLTRSLVARGLDVTAVDPGSRLLALAAEQVDGVWFVNAPFETAELPSGHFRAVFSASAFHWLDPDVSWSRAAGALSPGGTLALLQHCGVAADDDQEALIAILRRVAPEIAAGWPTLRPVDSILAGIEERAANVSEVWSWVGQYELGRSGGRLFDDVRAAAVPVVREHSATDLIALVRTLSPYHRMTADQQAALEDAIVDLQERLGRPFRSTTAAVLVSARAISARRRR
jgi:SAM-dependent methyltransferase